MLIEQIIEFELNGPAPPGRTCTSTSDKTKFFMMKQKSLRKNFE